MNKERVSLVVACFMGASTGALISLECARWFTYGEYFWILGALIGGCVAYVVVDFERVIQAVRIALKKSWSEFIATNCDWNSVKAILLFWLGALCLLATTSIYFVLTGVILRMIVGEPYDLERLIGGQPFLLTIVGIFVMDFRVSFSRNVSTQKQIYERMNVNGVRMLKNYNPFSVIFLLLVGVICYLSMCTLSIIKIVRFMPGAIVSVVTFIARFFMRVFVLIHSQRRTICFVDATLGATVGFFLGSAIIGGIAGAFFGLLNYEIVTKRILKIEEI